MVSVSEIIDAVEPQIGKLSKSFREEFKKNLLFVIKKEGAADIKAEFLKEYDKLAEIELQQFGPAIRGKDPTALHSSRDLFARQLDKELADIKLAGEEIVINIGNKSDLGFGKSEAEEGAPQTVDWLGFYLEGIVGEFAFITPEQYKARGRRSSNPLGRFGKGFLISRDRYKAERWQEVTGLTFEDVRHPISGQSPYRGFEKVPKRINFGKYINKALEMTQRKFEGSRL